MNLSLGLDISRSSRGGSSVPAALVLDFYAQDGSYFVKTGPGLTYNQADGSEPLVIDGVLRGDPSYTNVLASGSEDLTTWDALAGAIVTTDTVEFPSIYSAVQMVMTLNAAFYTVSFTVTKITGDNELTIRNESTIEDILSFTPTLTPQRVSGTFLAVDGTNRIRIQDRTGEGSSTVRITNIQLTEGPYLFPYIPPGSTVVSAAGTVGGNGLAFDTSGTQEVIGPELFSTSSLGFIDAAHTELIMDGEARTADWMLCAPSTAYLLQSDGNRLRMQYMDTLGAVIYDAEVENSSYPVVFTTAPDAVAFRVYYASIDIAGVNTFSAKSTQTITEPKSLALRQAFEGAPDGVELWVDPITQTIDASNYSTYNAETGVGRIVSDGATSVSLTISGAVSVGDITRWEIDVLTVSDGKIKAGTNSISNSAFEYLDAVGIYFKLNDVAETTNIVVFRGYGESCDVTFKLSVQKLTPATCTATALVNMGVGSNELVDGDICNLLTTDDTADHGLFYGCDSTGTYLAVSDGVTPIKTYITWDRGSNVLLEFVASADGSQYQLGYKRYTSDGEDVDAAVQYSALTAFAGTLTVADYARLFYENVVPVGVRAFETWSEPQEEATILKYMEKRLPTPTGWVDLSYFTDGDYWS